MFRIFNLNFYLLTLVMRQIKNETDKKLKNFMLENEKNKMSILGTKEETLKGKKVWLYTFRIPAKIICRTESEI